MFSEFTNNHSILMAFLLFFTQNQIFVLVWLSTQYIRLEILIAAPKLLKEGKYSKMSIIEKENVIKTKERWLIHSSFLCCFFYYLLRMAMITVLGIKGKLQVPERYEQTCYKVIMASNVLMFFLITLMYLKSIYMIQRSAEDQRQAQV